MTIISCYILTAYLSYSAEADSTHDKIPLCSFFDWQDPIWCKELGAAAPPLEVDCAPPLGQLHQSFYFTHLNVLSAPTVGLYV